MAWTRGIRLQHKVGAVDSGAVAVMKDYASVAEERHVVFGSGDVGVHILGVILAILRNDLAMLSRQITDLTELWCRCVARDSVRRTTGLNDMRASGGAVSILRNWIGVDVVAWKWSVVMILKLRVGEGDLLKGPWSLSSVRPMLK